MTERLAAVGRLAATIAHEINNPLEAVTNLLYLARSAGDPAQIQSFLTQADEELNRVSFLSKQTLGFYREKNGAKPLTVGKIAESLANVFSQKARNRSVEINLEIRQDPEIYAIEGEIRQVVANLLNNSIDAIVGSGTIRIRIASGRHSLRRTKMWGRDWVYGYRRALSRDTKENFDSNPALLQANQARSSQSSCQVV
jgi:signal transduction histidine kinase